MASPLLHKSHNHKSAVVGGVMSRSYYMRVMFLWCLLISNAFAVGFQTLSRSQADSYGFSINASNDFNQKCSSFIISVPPVIEFDSLGTKPFLSLAHVVSKNPPSDIQIPHGKKLSVDDALSSRICVGQSVLDTSYVAVTYGSSTTLPPMVVFIKIDEYVAET